MDEKEIFSKQIRNEISADTCPVPHRFNIHKEFERKIMDKDILFENTTGKIKNFISSNLQDDTIIEMLKIRE